MKDFFIEISNNLLDPLHCQKISDAVWLFMWLIDKMTSINEKQGKVLGGKPIKYIDIKKDLGISRSTYYRWMKKLEDSGYINTIRTPYGVSIVVLKAKKRFNKKVSDASKMTNPITCVKNDTSPTTINDTSDSINDTSLLPISTNNDTSNIRQEQNTRDKSNKTFANDPSGPDILPIQDSVTILYGEDKDKSPGALANDAIALFLVSFPGDFVGKRTAFAKPPTREAVEALLKRYSFEQIKELIRKYDAGKTDPYRPQVGTVYEFCTTKLAKVEAYVAKTGGLWAQKSISTPEQRADSDMLIKKRIEEVKERQRKNKAEWELNHPQN
jgi:DNA-binding MarR family transcriptional regulator